jgi:predicted secreted protein
VIEMLAPRRTYFVALIAASSLMFMNDASAGTTTTVSELQNGRMISVRLGSNLNISLHSTYWYFDTVKNLQQVKQSTVIPTLPGPSAPAGCQHPGTGCGTVQWFYKATKKGIASFTARRTSCGEALRCTPANSKFSIKFLIK